MKRSAPVLIFLILLLSCREKKITLNPVETAWLEDEDHRISVLFGYEAPPNAFFDEKGEYAGLLVDYAREIESLLGREIGFLMFDSWDELIRYSRKGRNFIVVGIADSAERRNFLSFTDPFIRIPYVLVSRKNEKIATLSETDDVRVGTVLNYSVNEYLAVYYPSITPRGYRDNLEGLRAVSTGDCDVMVLNQMYASYLIDHEGLSNLVISGSSGYQNELSLAVSSSDVILLGIMEKALNGISTARRKELYRNWVGSGSLWFSREFIISLIGGALILILVLILSWLWLITLRREIQKKTREIQDKENEILNARRLESLGVLAGGIAHDFNNLLTGVFGYMQLARRELEEDETAAAFLDEAMKSLEKTTRLTRQLLIFTGKKELAREKVHLDDLAGDTIRFSLVDSQVRLNYDASKGLSPVMGDQGQLEQVFTNLTVNARQAMDDKGQLTVRLMNEKIEGLDYVKMELADTGCGIEKENIEHIFDPYFTTKSMGSGLGLASCYSIITNHGGRISVDSTPGKGTIFTIIFPVE